MSGCFELKKPVYATLFLAFIIPFFGISQYTDVINSNRPGLSVSAYAIGKNVLQLESGLFYEQQDHNLLNTQSNIIGTDISLRYGLLFERLELNWETSLSTVLIPAIQELISIEIGSDLSS